MTSILIKSFNRPYYLDPAISSIYYFVEGDFEIQILDDGTPKKYLDKIAEKFPEVKIVKSKNYLVKSQALSEDSAIKSQLNGFQIPVDLWTEAVQKATNYFIITEDDVWFTQPLNLRKIVSDCEKFDINLLKLGWLGNRRDDLYLEKKSISAEIETTVPSNLFLSNTVVMEAFFYNHYKFYSLLYKLKKVDHHTRDKYWALNSILMGLYNKEYWLAIWKNMAGQVDEKRQLVNASVFYKENKHPNFIARLKKEHMKTTFQSSATNSYHEYGYDFDVNVFNSIINEAWFADQFDSLQNFPQDFDLEYFEKFISHEIKIDEFKKWVNHFKDQYQKLGADVN